MPRSVRTKAPSRTPLSRARVLEKAMELADAEGVESLSMRRLATSLGVEAMSLYNHVANKEAMLNGMAELVMAEIYEPPGVDDWKTELRLRYVSAHVVILAHPWAASLIESRRTGPVQMRSHNATLGCLRRAGFPIHLAHRAFLTLDSYLYGFAFHESVWPHERPEVPAVVARMLPEISQAEYPHIVELMLHIMHSTGSATTGAGAYRAEFEFGLDLILSGLQRILEDELRGRSAPDGDSSGPKAAARGSEKKRK